MIAQLADHSVLQAEPAAQMVVLPLEPLDPRELPLQVALLRLQIRFKAAMPLAVGQLRQPVTAAGAQQGGQDQLQWRQGA